MSQPEYLTGRECLDDTLQALLRQTIQLTTEVDAAGDPGSRENPAALAADIAWTAYLALTRLAQLDPDAALDVAGQSLRAYEMWTIPEMAQDALAGFTTAEDDQ